MSRFVLEFVSYTYDKFFIVFDWITDEQNDSSWRLLIRILFDFDDSLYPWMIEH